jgi:hypothetical protein
MNDFGFDLGLRMACANSIEQESLFQYAKKTGATAGVEPPRPLLNILLEFTQEKVHRAAIEDHDFMGALRALDESRVVMQDLVRFGHEEFKSNIVSIDRGLAKIAVAARKLIVGKYLDPKTSAEDVQLILPVLVELIERGAWPNWQVEFNEAVEKRRSW